MFTGWLDPDGNEYPCSPKQHGQVAAEVLGLSFSDDNAVIMLVQQGWLHIGPTPLVSFTSFFELPERQVRAIYSLLQKVDGLVKINLLSYIHA